MWNNAEPVTQHSYLEKNNIKAYDLKVDSKDNLLIPLTKGKELKGIQIISTAGEKKYLLGANKKGAYFKIGKITKGNPILLCEDYVTAASLHEYTNYPIIVSFDIDNLFSVCDVIKKQSPKNQILICTDSDLESAARKVALKLDVKLCSFNYRGSVNDRYKIKKQVDEALSGESEFNKFVDELNQLTPLEFERVKKEAANTVGITQSFLKSAMQMNKVNELVSNIDCIEDVEVFDGAVSSNDLFDEIEAILNQYVVLPDKASSAITLWIAGTYLFNSFRIFPKLVIFSPQKRCGKSTLLDVIEALTNKSMLTSNISASAIFRLIEDCQPVLLIDEADTFIAGRNDDMIGIVNSGHAKNRATVIRTVGDDHQPKVFSTWSPMVLASINPLQGPVMDRAVVIKLRRRMISETVQRLPFDLKERCKEIRSKLKRWAAEYESVVKLSKVNPPNIGNDRAIDNWLSLFMIADVLGEKWINKCLSSYKVLNQYKDEESIAIQLLKDIRSILNNHQYERVFTEELLSQLCQIVESPWHEYNRGRPLNGSGLAKILRQFDIYPVVMRRNEVGGCNTRKQGFEKKHFEDVFKRYLSNTPVTT